MILGIWLHARQDKYAHGYKNELGKKNRIHGKWADDITYRYQKKYNKAKKYSQKYIKVKSESMRGLIKKNSRLRYTINATVRYLKNVKKSLKQTAKVKFEKALSKKALDLEIRKYLNHPSHDIKEVKKVIKK